MRSRSTGLAVAVAAAAVASGCGLTGTPPNEPPAKSGRVTIDGNTRGTQSVKCTQVQWSLTINASTDPGRAFASLQLGGEKPVVQTVNIENINDVHGVAGGGDGNAEASTDGDIYTITGTVVGTDRAHPGQTRSMPFEIKAPC
ncbi:lipoprotein LpqH [Mycobacterium sp. MMS18-G62]